MDSSDGYHQNKLFFPLHVSAKYELLICYKCDLVFISEAHYFIKISMFSNNVRTNNIIILVKTMIALVKVCLIFRLK